jgi:YfiH family protein
MQADWLIPAWPAEGVGALMTTRHGGVSAAPFDSMNLRLEVGDAAVAVRRNRARLAAAIGAVPVYLNQVHGAAVVRLGTHDALPDAPVHTADASVSTEPGIACTAQVADCLPVLFAAPAGRAVGAAHAGWRGLALGVLEATVQTLSEAACCEPAELHAWLGACIGPTRFEVGADVLHAFGADAGHSDPARFVPCRPGKWLANLPQLAHDRLRAAGVRAISGGGWCTAGDSSRFFSFRRDGITGRMVAAVWRVG